jgi:radical SAM protein with 4Fe4S-binding SPASM domain
MDAYRIDGHKLLFHPERVSAWQSGQDIYPLYMEISPSGACNHRCVFCGLDFMGYAKRLLPTALLRERLTELGRLGLKSAMFAGEGEPFLHPDMVELAVHAKSSGIDVAFTTNGVLMREKISERILEHISWIKVSCNAGTPETYAAIHRTKAGQFHMVLQHLEKAADLRRRNGYACTLGMQILLLPENRNEITTLARLARDIGLDYLVVKPYSQHPSSETHRYETVRYDDAEALSEELSSLSTDTFKVIARLRAMRKWDEKDKPYHRCLALPFWSYLDAGGTVWGCSVYLGDERFRLGNIAEQTFEAIWTGAKRQAFKTWAAAELDPVGCRVNCRMDEINRYLWELAHPSPHVNFI